MNQFTVTTPTKQFTGESAGVVFKDGVGHVDDSTKEGRAAIEYFRRRGYVLTREDAEETTGDGPQEPNGSSGDDELFDPGEHSADAVLAYLDTTTDEDEIARVLEAEKNGKQRKTILARGEQQQEAQK
ncbi:hypothetical protein [Streptomyces sp. MK37H]|uniref:hypothetical protein n=1 Tax=Streptomyces sp. MK37H TaxID=2699117 RepID=UPI001B36A33F|nr:hypothetical protein [Streptomyces sp. MK37H]MBP8532360.1 hypothetical protein [Streptomyces sp. MK37H]